MTPRAILALQRTSGNRVVVRLLANRSGTIQRKPPPTKVTWTETTRTDTNVPPSLMGKVPTSFTLGSQMDADPLSTDSGGLVGRAPRGKSDWWPYLQARHKLGTGLYWVQGHLLNDNIHGPGEPNNLTPLSNTSNTNMETAGERAIKNAVLKQGKVVHYQVQANWRLSPADLHKTYGLLADGTGTLLWGEQFAPIGIDWAAWEKVETPTGSGNWVDGPVISTPAPSWYNTFPQATPTTTPTTAPTGFAMTITPNRTPTGCSIVINGTGFTDGAPVEIWFLGIPRTGEMSGRGLAPSALTQPVVGHRGPERAGVTPTVTGGAFTQQVDFPFTSTDLAHKFLSVEVMVKDLGTKQMLHQTVGAGNWVA